MATYGKKAQEERYGSSGKEGYRKERESLEKALPKSAKKDPVKAKEYIDKEMSFRIKQDTIEEHMKSISQGRGNGIPDNYKSKK